MILLGLIAVAVCGWILLLPLFPTQDGPMHLYFVRILQALLLHREPGILPQFYTVKHVLPPYALYYYLLIGLNYAMPLVRADQVVICLYVISFLFGFRFLAVSLGNFGNTTALLAAPLVLNWPLGMGFVNFCLSLSLSFWALGLWCRAAQQPNRRSLAGFILLCFAMMLTHPVPLAAVLGFCLVELAVRVRKAAAPLLPAALAYVVGASSMLYVLAFKGAHSLHQHRDHDRYVTVVLENVKNFYLLRTLTCFAGHSVPDLLYKGLYILLLLGGVALFVLDRRRRREPEYRDTLGAIWMGLGVGLMVLLPFLPPDLNNSHLFTARLVILVWIAVLAGTSCVRRGILPAIVLPALGVLLVVWTLIIGVQRVDPIAREIAQLETGESGLHGNVVLMLQDRAYNKTEKLSYDPYFWSPVRLLRRSGSVMYNTPWLDLPIIPVGAQPVMPTGRVDSYAMESPMDLRQDLESAAGAQDRAFFAEHVDALIMSEGPGWNGPAKIDPLLPLAPGQTWSCRKQPLLELCTELQAPR